MSTCVCGHHLACHPDQDGDLGACDLCACRRYLAAHLPGQMTIGGDT